MGNGGFSRETHERHEKEPSSTDKAAPVECPEVPRATPPFRKGSLSSVVPLTRPAVRFAAAGFACLDRSSWRRMTNL